MNERDAIINLAFKANATIAEIAETTGLPKANIMAIIQLPVGTRTVDLLAEALGDYWGEDEDEDGRFRQMACAKCGLDIEGILGDPDWRDRGGNRTCPEGDKHTPYMG